MATCLHCYKPIEAEKVAVLPDARYCVACAKKLYDKPKRVTQQDLFVRQSRSREENQRSNQVTIVVPNGVKVHKKQLPPVLREQVYDDGRSIQVVMGLQKSKKEAKRAAKKVSPWRYESSEQAVEGDVIFTESITTDEHNFLWIVDSVDQQQVHCHCESKAEWLQTFAIQQMKLLFRKEETHETKVKA